MRDVSEEQVVQAWGDATFLIGELIREGKTTLHACKLAVDYCNTNHPSVFDSVCEFVEKFSFNRRKYGGSTFTWAVPPNANGFYFPTLDPWKGTRYPKAILFVDVLQHFGTSTHTVTKMLADL